MIYAYGQPECNLPASFFEGRIIPQFHPQSLDFTQWWDEQITRCVNGWRTGGHYVTPVHYYHLNFKHINMVGSDGKTVMIHHPYFADEDQQLFIDIQDAEIEGKGIIIGTGRGFGKSFDIASVVEHKFTFTPASETIITSSIKKYATDLWLKVEIGLNSQPEQIRHSLLEDTKDMKLAGYKFKDPHTGKERKEGYFSQIKKIIYDSDPDKTRGTRPNIHVFEEGGSWSSTSAPLKDCYKKTEPSWWRGSRYTSLPIIIGTGGAMDTGGSDDFKEMFNNPGSFNLKSFEWDGEKIGKFIPAYRKFGGFYEKSGMSDQIGAKAFLDKRRESKMGDPDMFRQETMEFPFTPKEMFQVAGTGWMPIEALEKRYHQIETTPELKNIVQKGDLEFVYSGSRIVDVKWVPNPTSGIFEIAEHPEWTKPNWTKGKIQNLYISGCDSFDAVEENDGETKKKSNKSPGSIYMYKRFYDITTTSRFFVAKLTQRTWDAKEFYINTIKLNMYYNSKMLGEYTKIGIFRHYIETGYEYMLYPRPKLDTTILKNTTSSTNRYGIAMPVQIKQYVIKRYADWLKEPGTMEQMYYLSLINDNMNFSFEGYDKNKYDETMAASIALLADGDMYNVAARVKEAEQKQFPRFKRNAQGVMVFE